MALIEIFVVYSLITYINYMLHLYYYIYIINYIIINEINDFKIMIKNI